MGKGAYIRKRAFSTQDEALRWIENYIAERSPATGR